MRYLENRLKSKQSLIFIFYIYLTHTGMKASFFQFFLFLFFFFFLLQVSLCTPGCLGTYYIKKAGLKLTKDPPTSVSPEPRNWD